MTAKGKINASKVQAGDRIIIKFVYDSEGHESIHESGTKTGEGVQIVRVTGKRFRAAQGPYEARGKYIIETTAGEFEAATIQTMWLAPEDVAGIKRARAEAELENIERQTAEAELIEEENRFELTEEESLTLHSQDGKVDNMNNDASATQTENHTGSSVIRLLERIWTRIREDHVDLPEVVIVTGSGLMGGSKWGHFRADGWKVKEEGAALRKHELFLAGEALAKGAAQVLQTMLHEGAHTLAKVRDLKDTSRQGRWHNQTFRKLAEEMGLEHKDSSADSAHGFSFVTLTSETRERYADLLAELDAEIKLTCHLPVWLGGAAGEDDERGGEKITGKPRTTETSPYSGNLKATCGCDEPLIIRLSKKVLSMRVVACEACGNVFKEA